MDSVLFVLIFILVTLAQALVPARAQADPAPVQIEWSIDQAPENGWTVGDRIPLRLSASYPAGFVVMLPRLPNRWGPFEVQAQEMLVPVENRDGTGTAVSQMAVTPWAPGRFETPPVIVQYRDEGGNLHETEAPSLEIAVASVLQEGETEKADLKPQAVLPGPDPRPWVFGSLFFLTLGSVAGWIGYRYLRRRPRAASGRGLVVDLRPAHEIAYSELERIEALDLPAQQDFKTHYFLVADCVRTYVHGRYRIPALDLTTPELAVAMRDQRVERPHVDLIGEFLAQADLVKFAKFRPHVDQAYGTIATARHIVDITTPAEPADQSDATNLVVHSPGNAQTSGSGQDTETGFAHRDFLDR